MPLRTLASSIDEYKELIRERRNRPDEPLGYRTGFPSLDRYGGAVPGSFAILGGRPGMGKSAALEALGWNAARAALRFNNAADAAESKPRIACIYSLEQTSQVWLERQAFRMDTRLDSEAYRSGEFTDEQWDILEETVERLRAAPIYINDSPTVTVADMADELRQVNRDYDIRFVGLDFLQRMKEIQLAGELQFQKIGQIAESLADIGKDVTMGNGPKTPVPFWAAAQLRKPGGERGDDARPIMTDLYGSRQLEAAARFIILIYRQDYYHKATPGYVPNGEAEFIVEKNNNGPTGVIRLMYDAARTAFFERTEQ